MEKGIAVKHEKIRGLDIKSGHVDFGLWAGFTNVVFVVKCNCSLQGKTENHRCFCSFVDARSVACPIRWYIRVENGIGFPSSNIDVVFQQEDRCKLKVGEVEPEYFL